MPALKVNCHSLILVHVCITLQFCLNYAFVKIRTVSNGSTDGECSNLSTRANNVYECKRFLLMTIKKHPKHDAVSYIIVVNLQKCCSFVGLN